MINPETILVGGGASLLVSVGVHLTVVYFNRKRIEELEKGKQDKTTCNEIVKRLEGKMDYMIERVDDISDYIRNHK